MKEVYSINVELSAVGIVEVDKSSVADFDEACELVKRSFRAKLDDLNVAPTKGIVDYYFTRRLDTNIL